MINFPDEQRQEPDESAKVVIDPQTQEKYVLVRKDVYEKIKHLLDDDARVMYAQLANVDPDDWEEASVYEDKP